MAILIATVPNLGSLIIAVLVNALILPLVLGCLVALAIKALPPEHRLRGAYLCVVVGTAILGACNPPLAHRALSANPDVGISLLRNVTFYEEGDGAVVTAVNPVTMVGALQDDQFVYGAAEEAKTRLQRAIASLSSG